MASPSSLLLSRNWSYNVFASFHGPDVRKTLLSHMREQFNRNGITMFDDQEIVRGATIAPSLKEAIKESRISIVILSMKYASSSWCLDELMEILECKKATGQIVMTVFYGVDPSDVRKQNGDFGISFNGTCGSKTGEERQKWSKALNDVGNIAGEDFSKWDSEAKMIQKIATDVSHKLNATRSRDFDGMVGLEGHLRGMETLLDLDYDGVKMVAITGHAGIGKTTIARALHSLLCNRFQLTCFMNNLRENYHSGFDEYGMKLQLQEQFLSKILNQDGIRICHSGVIEERLRDQRVLIILDDVSNIKQLEALANEISWFGHGSRIIVTTENKELLQQHDINNIYHVGFPSDEEALEILCRYAFRKSYLHEGFKVLVERIIKLCGKLPLGLCVVGKSLRGKKEEECKDVMRRLETVLDQNIEDVLRVGYESLDENEKSIFLLIAVFFNYKDGDIVKTMLADGGFDVIRGLNILAYRSLIKISTCEGKIVIHKLLQQMARQIIQKKGSWKYRILMDTHEICDVLKNETGTGVVSGIAFDISRIDEVYIGEKAFENMPNLHFLSVYKSVSDGNDIMHIPEGMEFPRQLRLLQWEAYPSKCLPPSFHPEYLVELDMKNSMLEYLWQGTKKLRHLKKLDLRESYHLKELPDLSNATNLETLNLSYCESLIEIPSSCSHLHKLKILWMSNCRNLEVIQADMLNLASLEDVDMSRCSKLRNFSIISMDIKDLSIVEAKVQERLASISLGSRLECHTINNNGKLKGLRNLPTRVIWLDLSYSSIERLPHCIKDFHQLRILCLSGCRRLASLPELPSSLESLYAKDCESLETVLFHFNTRCQVLHFRNCFKLCKQARGEIIRQSIIGRAEACLPGRNVPVEFNHRARENSLTIHITGKTLPRYTEFVVCVVVSPNQTREYRGGISCRVIKDDHVDERVIRWKFPKYCQEEHLLILPFGIDYGFSASVFDSKIKPPQLSRNIEFEFSSEYNDLNIIECGVHICNYESVTTESIESKPSEAFEDQSENDDDNYWSDEFEPIEASRESFNSERTDDLIHESINKKNYKGQNHTCFWSWLILCILFGFLLFMGYLKELEGEHENSH